MILQPTGGNVGVGTTGPGNKLHIVGPQTVDSDAKAQLEVWDDAAYNLNPVAGLKFNTKFNAAGNYGAGGSVQVGKENTIDVNVASYMAFTTRPEGGVPTERVRITSTGNVGTGTIIPRYKNTTVGILSSLLSDDGTNYEGLTITPAAGSVTLAAVTAGTGTDNIDLILTPAGTGAIGIESTTAAGALGGTLSNSVATGNPSIWLRIKVGASYYAVPGWLIP